MRCLITSLHLSGTYDQLNSPCLASMETVDRRIAQIVEAYSGDGGKPRWAGVQRHGLHRSKLASCCCEENSRGTGPGEPPRGIYRSDSCWEARWARPQVPGADGEGTFAAKGEEPPETARSRPGGSDEMTVRQASGEGTTTGRLKSLGGGVVLDSLFLLPFDHELGPRPEEVEAGARMARRMSIPLYRVSFGALGQRHRLQLTRHLHRDKIW